MMDEVDQDAVIRTLLARFGDRPFRLRDLTDDQVSEIVDLYGAGTTTPQSRRIRLGRQLGRMDVYRCATEPNLGATLTIVQPAEGSRAAIYQIQHNQ